MVKCLRMICLVTAIGLPTSAWAQSDPDRRVGIDHPVAVVPDPAIPNVLYVVEQSGLVKVIQDGQVLATPFIDLRSAVVAGGEQGLLGMAFSPHDASRVFFNFTSSTAGPGHTVVARFVRTAADPWSPYRRAVSICDGQLATSSSRSHSPTITAEISCLVPMAISISASATAAISTTFPTTMRRRPVVCSGNSCGST